MLANETRSCFCQLISNLRNLVAWVVQDMFLPAQEAKERKFQQSVNITTLKNLCEPKDEIRQAVGLAALFVYSTVLWSQAC